MIKWTCVNAQEHKYRGQGPLCCHRCLHPIAGKEAYATDGGHVLCFECVVERFNEQEQAIETFRLNELKLLMPPELVWTEGVDELHRPTHWAPFGGGSPYVFRVVQLKRTGQWVCVTGHLGEAEFDSLDKIKQACLEYRLQHRIEQVNQLLED